MAELIYELEREVLTSNLDQIRGNIEGAAAISGRTADQIELLVAAKYVPAETLGLLAEVGIDLLGENRAQQLIEKQEAWPEAFTWDFIGHLQSRKVKEVVNRVRLIHSVASDSVLRELAKHGSPETEVLIEVNVSGEQSKSGIEPSELAAFIERCPVKVEGLMTMPPGTKSPEESRKYFAALRELAEEHGLKRLSMGTSQDYEVAIEEGATIVRLGGVLFK